MRRLRLLEPNAGGLGPVPGQRTKILHAKTETQSSQIYLNKRLKVKCLKLVTSEEKDMGKKAERLSLLYTFLYLNIYISESILLLLFYNKIFRSQKKLFHPQNPVGGRERGEFYLIKPVADVSLSGGPVWAHLLPLHLRAEPLSPPVPSCEPPSEVQTAHGSDPSTGPQDPRSSQGHVQYFWNDKGSLNLQHQKRIQFSTRSFLRLKATFIPKYNLLQGPRMYPSIS